MDELRERELGIGDLLAKGSHHFGKNIKNVLLFVLVFSYLVEFVIYFTPFRGGQFDGSFQSLFQVATISLMAIAFSIVSTLVGLITVMGIAVTIEESVKGNMITFKEALAKSGKVLMDCWLTGILKFIILFLLFLLLFIPGLIWSVYYIFAIHIVVLRGKINMDALRYSKALVKGRWWKVFGYSILVGLISLGLGAVMGLLSSPFTLIGLGGVFDLLVGLASKIISGYFTVVTTILFLNLDYLDNGYHKDIIDQHYW